MHVSPLMRWFLICSATLVTFTAALAQLVEIPFPRNPETLQTLNGTWKFRYAAGAAKEADGEFATPSFDDATWASIPVPAHWELHGFAEPKYAQVDEGVGYYRRAFEVPDAWRNQRVMLRFEGVLYGCEVWVNGKPVGEWASGYNPVTFDVTDALTPRGKNVLAVRVATRPKGWEFDTNDCWALSGIYRDVTLFAVPPTHFQRTRAVTTLGAKGQAQVEIAAWLTGSTEGARVHGILRDPSGAVVKNFEIPLRGAHGTASIEVAQPRLWTAETPHLYRLELTLERAGQPNQTNLEIIGLRQVTIADGVLQLNGAPIKLRGVNHHDIWPDTGRVATEAMMRRDLELIRAANCNFVRTSHYPSHPRLIELCDELGLYVMDEVPFGFGEKHLNDVSYQEILLTRARATVLRDENRPSVIIWSVGNENANTPLTFATGLRVKELDASRPICFPQIGSYFATSYHELPEWVDIYAPHYPSVDRVRDYARRLTRPVIFAEYAHALGLATDRIQDQWAIMQDNPRHAGGAVWMFQDQGILRTSKKPLEEREANPYVWLDAHRYYDTNKLDGMDGVVYSDRTPQTDYWQLRKVYSPVQVEVMSLPRATTPELSLEVKNHFDFRTLTGITLEWTLLQNRKEISQGKQPLRALARSTEKVRITLSPTNSDPLDFVSVRLRCLDEAGSAFYEKVVPLGTAGKSSRMEAILGESQSKPAQLEETPDIFRVTHANFIAELDRRSGELTLRDTQNNLLARGPLPHTGRERLTWAEDLRAKRDSIWLGATLSRPDQLKTSATQSPEGIVLKVEGQYPRNDTPGQALVGGFSATVRQNGAIDIAYDFTPQNATGRFTEAGVSFIGSPSASEFRWIGAGPYAGTPGKDVLNEFGVFHLNREDLSFGGNRRETEIAILSSPTGAGFALFASPSDIAVETTSEGVTLSHNALLAGRGNKGVQAETLVRAPEVERIRGRFSIIALGTRWPSALTRWVGSENELAPPHRPFHRSYDQ